MKKIIAIFATFMMLISGGMGTIEAQQLTKSQDKAVQKDHKKRAKELKKAGWAKLASTQPKA